MTKATKGLPTTSSTINRRALLRGGSIAVAAIASPAAAHAPRLAAAPSSAGYRILALIAELRALERVWESDADAASVRSLELNDAIQAIANSVTSRPIASLPDIIDRAILAAWACHPHKGELIPGGDDVGGLKNVYIVDVLALAGLRPEQCNAGFATA